MESLYGGRRTGRDYIEKSKYTGQEDCLYLNIDTPHFPAGKVPTGAQRLPVMVYFHGGGNLLGSGVFPVKGLRSPVVTDADA